MDKARTDLAPKIAVGSILVGALAVRLWGINYGLPYGFGNGDEDPVILNSMAFLALKTLQPVFFNYPALYSYLLLMVYSIGYLIGQSIGAFGSLTDLILEYTIHPGNYFLVGRVVTALFGTATVGMTYLIGSRNWNRTVGLCAAALLGFSFTHITQSHWALPDVPMTFFTTAALYFIFKLFWDGKTRSYVYCGVLCGLAISTKYNAGLILVPFLVAHFLGRRAEGNSLFKIVTDKRLLIAGTLIVYSFLLTSPYWILNFGSYFAALQFESEHMRIGHIGSSSALPWLWVFIELVKNELLLGVLFLFGVGYAIIRPSPLTRILVALVSVTFLYIGSWSKTGLHYLLPIWVPLALLAARGTYELIDKLARNASHKRLLTAGIVLCILLPTAVTALWRDYQMSNTDTRTTAKAWIEANLPAATPIGLTWYEYNPPLASAGSPFMTATILSWPDAGYQKKVEDYLKGIKTYRLTDLAIAEPESETGPAESAPSHDDVQVLKWKSIGQLRNEGVEYIILSSYVYDRYWTSEPPPLGNPLRPAFDANRNYFEGMLNSTELTPVQEFVPDSTQLGPTLQVYQIKAR